MKNIIAIIALATASAVAQTNRNATETYVVNKINAVVTGQIARVAGSLTNTFTVNGRGGLLSTNNAVTLAASDIGAAEAVSITNLQGTVSSPASDFTYSIIGGEVTVTGYIGSDTNIVVPSMISGFPVVGIGTFCFTMSTRSVYLPDTVRILSHDAFGYAKNMERVRLSDNIATIPYSCFLGNVAMQEINLPRGLTSIEELAFESCYALKTVRFGPNVRSIGTDSFWECLALESITLPESLESIANTTFAMCLNLKTVYFNGNAPNVGTNITEGCRDFVSFYKRPGAVGFGDTLDGRPVANFGFDLRSSAEITAEITSAQKYWKGDNNYHATLDSGTGKVWKVEIATNYFVSLSDNFEVAGTHEKPAWTTNSWPVSDGEWNTIDGSLVYVIVSWDSVETEYPRHLVSSNGGQGTATVSVVYTYSTNYVTRFATTNDLAAYVPITSGVSTNQTLVNAAATGTLTLNGESISAWPTGTALALTPISNVATGSVVTIAVSGEKKIYAFDLAGPATITNDLTALGLNCTSNAAWEMWVNVTATNALTPVWDARLAFCDDVPRMTVTGLYKFACSSSCGTKILADQYYPSVYEWKILKRPAINSAFPTAVHAYWDTTIVAPGVTNGYFQMIPETTAAAVYTLAATSSTDTFSMICDRYKGVTPIANVATNSSLITDGGGGVLKGTFYTPSFIYRSVNSPTQLRFTFLKNGPTYDYTIGGFYLMFRRANELEIAAGTAGNAGL